MGFAGFVRRVLSSVRAALSPAPKPAKKTSWQWEEVSSSAGCVNVSRGSAEVLLDGLAIRVRCENRLDVPYETTVVVPRAEITKRYKGGQLIETTLVYSSITVVHSPRPLSSSSPRGLAELRGHVKPRGDQANFASSP